MAPLPALATLLAGIPLVPPPALPAPATAPQQRRAQGNSLSINGQRQQARWLIEGGELWLPVEVLEGQLGVSRRGSANNGIALEWFGNSLKLPAHRLRSLDDEVAVPVAGLLEALGVRFRTTNDELTLELPTGPLQAIRSRDQGISGKRVVLDLSSPALVRSGESRLMVSTLASAGQLQQLRSLGLNPSQSSGWLSLKMPAAGQILTLSGPWRLVVYVPSGDGSTSDTDFDQVAPAAEKNPRLVALQNQGLQLQRRLVSLGNKQLLLNTVRLDPQRVPLELRLLKRTDGMQGLSSLSQLARQDDALIAINGGYFNRVNRLPLGAMRDQGHWLSGPILNRGVVAWSPRELPRFDRLTLLETIEDSNRRRWTVTSVNSGYVQKGLARYTADWGSRYQPISGTEMGVLVRNGVVRQRFELGELNPGVTLSGGDLLIVARGGVSVPWQNGERLTLHSRPSSTVGDQPNLLGGGPLLLLHGRVVLNGTAEGFSSGFLSQGAPRTVVGSDGRQLWLITIQGVNNPGPTLLETTLLMRQEGLQDALNLDGGSSTGLVLADVHTVKGRGVAAAVHNGLGLVPRIEQARTPELP